MVSITADYENGELTIYRNGIKFNSLNMKAFSSFTPFPSSNRIKYIGNYGDSYPFDSNLDEFAIWSRLLNQNEITQLYNNGLGKTHPFLGTTNDSPVNTSSRLILTSELNNRLIAYYKMDSSLGYAKDELCAYNGTISGALQNQSGKLGNSFQFDGVNNYVTTAASLKDCDVTGLTYACWIDPSLSLDSIGHIICGQAYTNRFGIGNAATVQFNSNPAGASGVVFSITPSLNTWHFLAITAVNTSI